jgi:hypothetical protein
MVVVVVVLGWESVEMHEIVSRISLSLSHVDRREERGKESIYICMNMK